MKLKNIFRETNVNSLKTFDEIFKEYHDFNNNDNDVKSVESMRIDVAGWVKTYRNQGDIIFIGLNDGSTHNNIQVIYDNTKMLAIDPAHTHEMLSKLSVGATVELNGVLVKPPSSSKESLELHVTSVYQVGEIRDRKTYILSKGRVKPESMRQIQHLRFKTNYFSAIMKVRSKALSGLREFFENKDFYHIDPNVITVSDCEGAGEVFQIVAPHDKINGGKTDFFNKKAYLTVSSQLQLEAACAGLGNCYTMNPSFRAEKSSTSRHMASFTHVEYEASFGGLEELMNLSEHMVKHVVRKCLTECTQEYDFLDKFYTKGIASRLQSYLDIGEFPRISYTNALSILNKAKKEKNLKISDEEMPSWGDDLGSVCEKYLAEEMFQSPIMVYNYPKKLKSFYMKEDEIDSNVVNCMDMLVPYIGELIGSSVREDDYDKLIQNMKDKDINPEPLEWYVDLRRNGTWRHYGGGLGFERLVGLLTMDNKNFNVRDCCAFPVCYSECHY